VIYEMQCDKCGAVDDVQATLAQHEVLVKPGIRCSCGGMFRQIFTAVRGVFAREGFPKGDPQWEHASPDPLYIRDKVHLRDVCQEHGNVSRYLEDAG